MITSGTTGFPKGCVIDHETYALRSLNNAISRGAQQSRTGTSISSPSLQCGTRFGNELLYLGGTVFLLDKFDEENFLNILEQEQITYTILVPALCQRLLRHPDAGTREQVLPNLCRNHRRPSHS